MKHVFSYRKLKYPPGGFPYGVSVTTFDDAGKAVGARSVCHTFDLARARIISIALAALPAWEIHHITSGRGDAFESLSSEASGENQGVDCPDLDMVSV